MSKRSIGIAVGVLALVGLLVYFLVPLLALLDRSKDARVRTRVAALIEAVGNNVERDFAEHVGVWSNARQNPEFFLGDGCRTGPKATALLALADGSMLHVRPGTTLRFLPDQNDQKVLGVDVISGEAMLRAGKSELRLRTHVGLAVLEADSQVTLRRDAGLLSVSVQLGSLHFQDDKGAGQRVRIGEAMEIGIGMAVLEKVSTPMTSGAAGLSLATDGPGVRRRTPGHRNWEDLSAGNHALAEGTELSLAADTRAELSSSGERVTLRGPGLYIAGLGDTLLEGRAGTMQISAQQHDVKVSVPGGLIIVRAAQGNATLQVGEDRGRLNVSGGNVSATLNGSTEELGVGDERSWSTTLVADEDGPRESAGGDARGPSYSNLSVRAGDSFVLHAPELPVSVGFDFSAKCGGDAELELVGKRQKSRGTGSANLLFGSGTRAYTVRCLGAGGAAGRVVARGNVHVLQDAGTRKLPPSAPASVVEGDGRTYTIYYQNQLPDVRLSWPNAPSEKSYVLEVDGKTEEISAASHVFKSGTLRDGTHRLSFRGTSRRSRTTTVEVRFDNNAPTASLSQPADRSFSAGASVKVEGVSLQAWKVSLDGGTIEKQADGRFSGTIASTSARPDIAVRLTHPKLGTHYYLRRAASSP